jgi:hypothetical protein
MALMKEAKALMPTNAIIDGLIAKEIIGMLAPPEAIPQYEQAYIDTITDPQVKTLMTTDNEQVLSRDLGSQIPTREEFGERPVPAEGDEAGADGGYTSFNGNGGPGTPIQDTGQSYYTQQAVAVQLTGINSGR